MPASTPACHRMYITSIYTPTVSTHGSYSSIPGPAPLQRQTEHKVTQDPYYITTIMPKTTEFHFSCSFQKSMNSLQNMLTLTDNIKSLSTIANTQAQVQYRHAGSCSELTCCLRINFLTDVSHLLAARFPETTHLQKLMHIKRSNQLAGRTFKTQKTDESCRSTC